MQRPMVRTADGARICVDVIGSQADPALLLIAGMGWSMDWWDEQLCRRLADRGRRVVRYDHRDTGRSTTYPVGAPGYTGADLAADAVAVLDGLAIERAHVAGLSMGGGIAQVVALEHRERLAALTLMSTTSVAPDGPELPGPSPQLMDALAHAAPEPDWTDRDAVIGFVVEGERPFAGPGLFDEEWVRTLAARAVDRSTDIAASLTNHELVAASGSAGGRRLDVLRGLPTLVLHGTADPLFPLAHGRALADGIPGARFVALDGVGHQLPPPRLWPFLVDTLVEHAGSPPDA